MSNIYEKIKASSALKANAALIQGAADSAKKFVTPPDQSAPSQAPKAEPITTEEEETDQTDPKDVVSTDTTTPPAKIISALKYGRSPAKETDPKESIKKSMGKGFVGEVFGDVTEETTGTAAVKDDYDGDDFASNEDWAAFLKTPQGQAYTEKYTTGTEEKKYTVKPTETKTEVPGTKSNYNMSWKNALSAKMSEGVQRRDAKQDMNQYNRDVKGFDRGSFFGLGKKGSNKINPATGKKFADAIEYADYKAGRSGDRDSSGNLEAGVEYNQRLNSTKGRDTDPTTKVEKDKYDETKHGKREDITYKDSKKTVENTADDAVGKFKLQKKSSALKNFKYKK